MYHYDSLVSSDNTGLDLVILGLIWYLFKDWGTVEKPSSIYYNWRFLSNPDVFYCTYLRLQSFLLLYFPSWNSAKPMEVSDSSKSCQGAGCFASAKAWGEKELLIQWFNTFTDKHCECQRWEYFCWLNIGLERHFLGTLLCWVFCCSQQVFFFSSLLVFIFQYFSDGTHYYWKKKQVPGKDRKFPPVSFCFLMYSVH